MRIKTLCDRSSGKCKSGGLTKKAVNGVEKVTEDRWFWDPAGEKLRKTYTTPYATVSLRGCRWRT